MFMGLGDLPGGQSSSFAEAVSADGSAVVGYSYSALGQEAFRWTASEGMVGLGDVPGGPFASWAQGVSADGSVVVGFGRSAVGDEAFMWTPGGVTLLGDLPGGIHQSVARDVSDDGSVIVGNSASSSGAEAFRWTASTGMVGLGDVAGGLFSSVGTAVSTDGSVVVGWGRPGGDFELEASRWTASTGMLGLGDLPGGPHYGQASDVSADGSVVVGGSKTGPGFDDTHAFRWTAGSGMVDLGLMPGHGSWASPPISVANAVSADGSIVVGSASSPTSNEAFIWDEANGMRQVDQILIALGLDLGDWTLITATGVSADGLTITGWGSPGGIGSGTYEAWIAVIPEPNTALLLMSGLLGLAYRQKRRGRAPN
jgi:probable HAF family extracellular repeat protein